MQQYLVVGLGATGQSVLEFLCRQPNTTCIGFDTRANFDLSLIRARFPKVVCHLGEVSATILKSIKALIVSPGVPLKLPIIMAAQQQGLPVFGDIELFYQHARAPIIGITGTNAKSTVTTLVTDMINAAGNKAQMGGNIGLPALRLLDFPEPDYYVLELSSFQLELTRNLQCLSAAVLNVSPDHLDRHGTLAEYQRAKERIYLHCKHPVYFRALPYQYPLAPHVYTFGVDAPERAQDFGVMLQHGEPYFACGSRLLMPVAELSPRLPGEHNVINALSALALTAALKLELEPQLQVLRTFKGLPHRCVHIGDIRGVAWFNDSKGTNIGATAAAIKGLSKTAKGRIILILGGVGKEQDFSLLVPVLQQFVSHTLIFGRDKAKIAAAIAGESHELADTLDAVIDKAYAIAQKHDIVLFSPACASFDMFRHYEHRGEVFTEKVNQLRAQQQDQ